MTEKWLGVYFLKRYRIHQMKCVGWVAEIFDEEVRESFENDVHFLKGLVVGKCWCLNAPVFQILIVNQPEVHCLCIP